VHRGIVGIAEKVRQRLEVPAGVTDPLAAALARNARAMIDVDYAGSPLIADYRPAGNGTTGAAAAEPHPGQRYPDWIHFGGTSHHLLVFGALAEADALTQLGQRWSSCVKISRDPGVKAARAGVPTGGMVLIRPDGHIGFRAPGLDAGALAALDRHLSCYLVA
jgi:hypothetical protein